MAKRKIDRQLNACIVAHIALSSLQLKLFQAATILVRSYYSVSEPQVGLIELLEFSLTLNIATCFSCSSSGDNTDILKSAMVSYDLMLRACRAGSRKRRRVPVAQSFASCVFFTPPPRGGLVLVAIQGKGAI